jgi:hypothetical protein
MKKNTTVIIISFAAGIICATAITNIYKTSTTRAFDAPTALYNSEEAKAQYRTANPTMKATTLSKVQMMKHLDKLMPNVTIQSNNVIYIESVDMFQIHLQGKMFYIAGDGSAVVKGDVMDVAMMWHDPDRANLTLEYDRALSFARQQFEGVKQDSDFDFADSPEQRVDLLHQLPSETVINYPASAPLIDTMYVFFDVNCPACAKLFPEIGDLNALGYAVNVVLVAKDGPRSKSYEQSQRILCQSNPVKSLSLFLKKGFANFAVDCKGDIDFNHSVFDQLGLTGTPYILSSNNGHVFRGLHYAGDIHSIMKQQYDVMPLAVK